MYGFLKQDIRKIDIIMKCTKITMEENVHNFYLSPADTYIVNRYKMHIARISFHFRFSAIFSYPSDRKLVNNSVINHDD